MRDEHPLPGGRREGQGLAAPSGAGVTRGYTAKPGLFFLCSIRLTGDWRKTQWPEEQEGVLYVLRDRKSGELLKVGKSEVGTWEGRFEPYARAARKTGRELELDAWTVPKDSARSLEYIEAQVRAQLESQGHKLPWDNTGGRLGRPGPGVPGVYQSSTAKQGYVWDGENYVKRAEAPE